MVAFLDGQVELLGKQVEASSRGGQPAELQQRIDEAVSLAMFYFQQLRAEVDRALPPDQWDEAVARQFIPRFQSWFAMAEKTLAFLRECRVKGVTPASTEPFMFAYLESKAIALHFDQDLEASRRIERGESQGRPLQELLDELLRSGRTAG